MSLPPPPPPVQRFVSARPVVVNSTVAGASGLQSAAPESAIRTPPAPASAPPLHISRKAADTATATHTPSTAQTAESPPFDIEDIEALRAENRLLHQRLAVFLQPADVSDSTGIIRSLETSDPVSANVMRGLIARMSQLEAALQWECARREDAEEKLQAALRIVAALSE